nr:carboxyl transferase domain-containing protein [Virgibacillus sp. NKC19-3]
MRIVFCEIKKKFAPELITGLARINGKSVGIIANQPRMKGGVLFPDSADKAAKLFSFVMRLIFHYYSWRMFPDL